MKNEFEQFKNMAKENNAIESYVHGKEFIAVFLPPFSSAQGFQIQLEELSYDATDEGQNLANFVYDGAVIEMQFDEEQNYCFVHLIPE